MVSTNEAPHEAYFPSYVTYCVYVYMCTLLYITHHHYHSTQTHIVTGDKEGEAPQAFKLGLDSTTLDYYVTPKGESRMDTLHNNAGEI